MTTTTNARIVTVVLAALAVVVLLPLLFVGGGMMGTGPMGSGPMGFGPMMGGQGGMWTAGTAPGWLLVVNVVLRLAFLALVAVGGYLLYRALTRDADEDDALAELRLAYARGDLDDDEYERRREVLERE
ncbi:SHOCT domain-containing protein [Salinigranum halophilum]|uniref:SHOCT domain-containing protein n=1 Tax=Salinigranum halophilum TaxID=2565931 RepID=UPI0010A7A42D|nr:SHOCT domain-containing protein [Salinigranum halophilum]